MRRRPAFSERFGGVVYLRGRFQIQTQRVVQMVAVASLKGERQVHLLIRQIAGEAIDKLRMYIADGCPVVVVNDMVVVLVFVSNFTGLHAVVVPTGHGGSGFFARLNDAVKGIAVEYAERQSFLYDMVGYDEIVYSEFKYLVDIRGYIAQRCPVKVFRINQRGVYAELDAPVGYGTDVHRARTEAGSGFNRQVHQQVGRFLAVHVQRNIDPVLPQAAVNTDIVLGGTFPFQVVVAVVGSRIADH